MKSKSGKEDLIRNGALIASLVLLSTGCYFMYPPLALVVPSSIVLGILAFPYLSQPKGGK